MELVVCDYERENQDDWSAGGTCFLYAGESGGLNPDAIWVEESDSIAAFGHSVALANDINGDGFPDLIVGAPQKNSFGQIDNGRVYFFYGGNEQTVNGFEWKTTSNQAGAQLGYAVASAGDVNGDGFSDVLVGAPFFDNGQQDEGKAFLYLGDEKGPSVTHDWSVEGNQIDARLGISVATAGDVNGDEFSDVIIGASKYSNGVPDEGAAFIFHGSQSGLNQVSDRTISGNQSNALFGWMVGSAGDVDADGYGDIFVTARHYDNGHNNEGRVYLFEGSATGIGSSAAWQFESNQPGAQLGYSAALLGDVNGDGFSDVIFGAPFHDLGGNNAGRVFAFHGSINGLNNTPDWTQVSNQANAWFGRSVSSAGDVNGDGYSDVLVGAPNFDSGQINEGVAYLFAGSASGITDTSSWEGQIDQPDAKFGWSVNFAGDLNADGFGDVTIGAPFFDNDESDEGGIFIYYGSPSFFPAEPSAIYESNQSGANLGFSVALAGDVNNDGFSAGKNDGEP